MRDLDALISTPDGRRSLERRGVFVDPGDFEGALREPVGHLQGTRSESLVYAGHQLQADYRASVVDKLRLLRDLSARGTVSPLVVWLDTDRVGSQASITTIVWDLTEEMRIRLTPHRLRDLETRFVEVDGARAAEVFATVGGWVEQLGGSTERSERLVRAAALAPAPSLAAVNLVVSDVLLSEHLTLDAPRVLVSSLLDDPGFVAAIADTIRHLDDVIAVANESIETLRAADIDPVLRPFDDDYLPLHFSCPKDGTRSRLRRADATATATCRCGETFRFPLQDGRFDELAATRRWSVDVLLPAFLDGFVAGVVGGRTSALYGLVLNDIVAKVFARTPAPMIVPAGRSTEHAGPDSLLYDYLVGS